LKIIVTGAAGFIGKRVCLTLVQFGHYVYGFFNQEMPDYKSHNIVFVQQDLLTLDKSLFNWQDIDVIIHCAAALPSTTNDERACYRYNKKIDENLFRVCAEKKNILLIYLSSIYIDQLVKNNELSTKPYQLAKFESEEFLKHSDIPHFILRISSPYGREQKSKTVLNIFINNAKNGQNLYYYGTGLRTQDFIHVDDVATAVLACIESGFKNLILNICSSTPVSMIKLAQIIKSYINSQLIDVLPNCKPDPQELFRASFSNQRTIDILKWSPKISLEEGLKEMIQ
jgi:UDP-glucose 4-epimerase